MIEEESRQLLTSLFISLRRAGFNIGVGELLAAMRAAEGWHAGDDQEELKLIARLIWCGSREEVSEFESIWEFIALGANDSGDKTLTRERGERKLLTPEDEEDSSPSELPLVPESNIASSYAPAVWAPLPIRLPYAPAATDHKSELQTYWPVPRRFMAYAWRYLRHPVPDGPEEILDVQGTVEHAARQGFYLSPVFQRRERNHAHLILLLDQGGSMVPFHSITRDLAETAQYESNLGRVDLFYFHNVWSTDVYLDPRRTLPISADSAFAECTGDSSVLIVSDGGAARGFRRQDRVHDTADFIHRLKRHTALIAWLNPMPTERWMGTSAQIISKFIPMFQMDPDGLSSAVDALRGQSLQHSR
jgi:uncharacterized protein with von Willebrand factor type A (vWA) domain